jgi:hypothetical protein
MTDIQAGLMIGILSIAAAVYSVFGICIALADISNKEILTPKDFHEDKYNWFGSWVIFIGRTILAVPFYILFSLCLGVYKVIMSLFTAGRDDD